MLLYKIIFPFQPGYGFLDQEIVDIFINIFMRFFFFTLIKDTVVKTLQLLFLQFKFGRGKTMKRYAATFFKKRIKCFSQTGITTAGIEYKGIFRARIRVAVI